ncbi:MAG: DUF1800 domain-containing protein [Acidimicrobiales bacterium]
MDDHDDVAADADRITIARLHRRAGFGLAPGELEARASDGVAATIDRLVDPDAHGGQAAVDPWADVELTPPTRQAGSSKEQKQQFRKQNREQSLAAIGAWIDHLATTSRPLESWMTWFWHGHLVSGLDKVKSPFLMVQQLRTYQRLAFAPFPELLRAATVDPAMLIYLDGRESTGSNPNENYGREVMELFSLGVGAFSEDDVIAASVAFTGWRFEPGATAATLVPGRHDDSSQTLLGRTDVHDVDSAIAAITSHPACGPWVAGKLAKAMLGPDVDPAFVQGLGTRYAASGFDTRALLRELLAAVADGQAGGGGVWAPVPWLAAARRATTAAPPAGDVLKQLRAGGQVPMTPPNVAGWPAGAAWFASSTVVARFDLAGAVAAGTPAANPARDAAARADVEALAMALGRPEGFGPATRDAISRAGDPTVALAIALSSPDHSLL